MIGSFVRHWRVYLATAVLALSFATPLGFGSNAALANDCQPTTSGGGCTG